jgi:RND family efflux transporter MFP subunit
VRKWYKDIGAKVHRGDVLAEIDTPELDQQIAQAKADDASAEAARDLSRSTAARWTNLVAVDAVSKQEAEEKTGDFAAKTALVNAAEANVDRLTTMKTFARITAPFDGEVTERTIDIGALVNAGSGAGASALFTIADTHKLRVYVRVPQNYSAQIRPPMTAQLMLPEYPAQTFPATLVSTSNAISDQSNTLLAEFEADNPDGKLKPGAYAQVSVKLPESTHVVSIPSSALLFRSDGLHVATLGSNNRVVLKTVTIGEDLGTDIEISSGLNANDRVIDSPPDSLVNGDTVRVADADADADTHSGATASAKGK